MTRVSEGTPPGIAREVLGRALANALLIEGQLVLERVSTEDDIELFFEVYSREEPDTTEWARAILKGISGHTLDAATLRDVCEHATARAVGFVQQDSALAFGNHRES